MSMVLLVLGVVTAAAGAVMVGFGIPINEFSLGNTLIISGMTALVGGLVVIALSVATRQLNRIAALLNKSQPMPRRGGEGFDQTSSDGSGPGRMPFPPRPMPERGPETRFAPPPPPAPAPPSDPIFERLRSPQPPAAPRSEARQADTPLLSDEDAPLSPLPPRGPRTPADPHVQDDMALSRMLRAKEPAQTKAPQPARNGSTPYPSAPSAPESGAAASFNDVWPDEPKADPFASRKDPFARHPEPPARPNGDHLRDSIMRDEPSHAPVSILKSGVVDGMAYTLYTDGSIEAELAQGVVRFGSIEELRNHLEKSH